MGSIKVTISELAAASKLASRDMASGDAVFDRNLAVASGIMHHSATGRENIPSDVTAAAAEYFLVAGIKHLSNEDIDRVASIGRSIRTLGSMLTSTEHEHSKHAWKVLSLTADVREVAMGAAIQGGILAVLPAAGLLEGLRLFLRYTAAGEHVPHLPDGQGQRLRVPAVLMLLDAAPQLLMDRLHHVIAAILL